MKLSDFMFLNFFISQEKISIDTDINVEIIEDSKTDVALTKGKNIELHSPSSISKTLFNLTQKACGDKIENPYKSDVFSLVLIKIIHDYVYRDTKNIKLDLPVLFSGAKIKTTTIIIKDVIEPLIDEKIDLIPSLLIPCNFTDACRIIESQSQLSESTYEINKSNIPYTRYPFILCNSSIENRASFLAHLLVKQLEVSLGEEKTKNLIKHILLDESEILLHLINIVYGLEQCVNVTDDFVTYLKSYSCIEKNNKLFVTAIEKHCAKQKVVKLAQQLYDTQVRNQWSEWAMLMGLTEKQLEGFRGSKYDTTKLMAPFDQEREQLKERKRKRKGKKNLNMEELLEIYREQYESNAIEPGKLCEVLLKQERVW